MIVLESISDYWAFIEEHHPKYYSCDKVLLSDILTRKLEGEEICESDEEYIKDRDIRSELLEVNRQLFCEAFESFFNNRYVGILDK